MPCVADSVGCADNGHRHATQYFIWRSRCAVHCKSATCPARPSQERAVACGGELVVVAAALFVGCWRVARPSYNLPCLLAGMFCRPHTCMCLSPFIQFSPPPIDLFLEKEWRAIQWRDYGETILIIIFSLYDIPGCRGVSVRGFWCCVVSTCRSGLSGPQHLATAQTHKGVRQGRRTLPVGCFDVVAQ